MQTNYILVIHIIHNTLTCLIYKLKLSWVLNNISEECHLLQEVILVQNLCKITLKCYGESSIFTINHRDAVWARFDGFVAGLFRLITWRPMVRFHSPLPFFSFSQSKRIGFFHLCSVDYAPSSRHRVDRRLVLLFFTEYHFAIKLDKHHDIQKWSWYWR